MNTNNQTQEIGLQVLNEIFQDCWQSTEFKHNFIENPHITIEKVIGGNISRDVNFKVEDQSDSSVVYLNIPAKRELDTLELSDEQLELVAGGEIGIVGTCLIIAGCAAAAGAIGYAAGYYMNKKN